MKYLIDTCVISEFTRRKPEPGVISWLDETLEDHLFLSVVALGEVRRGIERLPASDRKTALSYWLANDLLGRFGQRVLPIDTGTMFIWGELTNRMETIGRPMPVMDSLIAATAIQHKLVIATRNEQDFSSSGVLLFNPWLARLTPR